jgi:CubicO group peptidase (beta-lactamase class C family)
MASSSGLSLAAPRLLPDRVYQAAQERVAAGYYPTLVIAYVANGKSEVDAFGALADGKTTDGDTVFEIGSITKTFTATLLAQAVQAGSIKLDAPLADLLPDFSIPTRNAKQITLLDIATQFSGLPRLPTNLNPANQANPYADYGPVQLKSFLSEYKLPRDPGESYEYSNLGFGILGYALAEHARTSYANLLRTGILRPLGMSMTDVTTTKKLKEHLAEGHNEEGRPVGEWDFDVETGAGAIRSTGNDMLRYLKANMGVGQSSLASAVKSAQEPRRDINKDTRIGLAWMTKDHVIQHGGATAGYVSFIGFLTDGSRGIVVLTNTASSPEELAFAALNDDAPLSKTENRKAISLDTTTLDDYVGVYKLSDSLIVTVSRMNNQLSSQATGQGPFLIFPSERDQFFAKIDGISLTFKRDSSGKVSGFVLHQHGDANAPKLSAADAASLNKAVVLDATLLRDYVGKYQMEPNVILELDLKDGQLYAGLTGQPSFPIYAHAKDKLFYTVVDAQLDFARDDKGAVTGLVLHQGGEDHHGTRIKP